MSEVYCDMPTVKCPHCGCEWQWDDYYEVERGDDLECHQCGKTFYVEAVDTTINVRFTTENPK